MLASALTRPISGLPSGLASVMVLPGVAEPSSERGIDAPIRGSRSRTGEHFFVVGAAVHVGSAVGEAVEHFVGAAGFAAIAERVAPLLDLDAADGGDQRGVERRGTPPRLRSVTLRELVRCRRYPLFGCRRCSAWAISHAFRFAGSPNTSCVGATGCRQQIHPPAWSARSSTRWSTVRRCRRPGLVDHVSSCRTSTRCWLRRSTTTRWFPTPSATIMTRRAQQLATAGRREAATALREQSQTAAHDRAILCPLARRRTSARSGGRR